MKKLFVFLFIVMLAFCAKYDISITIKVSKEREASRAEMLESTISFLRDYNPGSILIDLWTIDSCAEGDVHDPTICPELREKY